MSALPDTPGPSHADVIEAMRSVQSESDRWNLAEILAKAIPKGSSGFTEIIDAAIAEGVAGELKANTLRLYRDAANRWPADKRVPNVSFSAHREVMVLPGGVAQGAKMLADLEKNLGAGKVTVQSVRKAIRVQSGKAPVTKNGAQTPATPKLTAPTADALLGCPALIASVTGTTAREDLDKIHDGLNKALTHVDALRAKANRKANVAKRPASKPATPAKAAAKAPTKKAAPARKGNIRGL